jgi:hypothetical protein
MWVSQATRTQTPQPKNPERANTKHLKVSSSRPHKVDRTERSKGATRKIEQHDNRNKGAQTTHQKQQGHPNNDQKESGGNQPTRRSRLFLITN